tara:strand:- start:5 stop:283 length:279 start_codon:yes stop_codon:yes gene_type:complete
MVDRDYGVNTIVEVPDFRNTEQTEGIGLRKNRLYQIITSKPQGYRGDPHVTVLDLKTERPVINQYAEKPATFHARTWFRIVLRKVGHPNPSN